MIFHASIPADDPDTVAAALAELWQGESLPFPPWPGARVVFAGDERASTLEVYPRNRPMTQGEAMVEPREDPHASRETCWHLAVATALSAEAVTALAERQGWRALRCNRGGMFEVIELWIENTTLFEVLTGDMQADYRRTNEPANWRSLFGLPAAA